MWELQATQWLGIVSLQKIPKPSLLDQLKRNHIFQFRADKFIQDLGFDQQLNGSKIFASGGWSQNLSAGR